MEWKNVSKALLQIFGPAKPRGPRKAEQIIEVIEHIQERVGIMQIAFWKRAEDRFLVDE
mgnify:CR=1 FL=1